MTNTLQPISLLRVLDAREGQIPETYIELPPGNGFGYVTRLTDYIPSLNGNPATIVAEYDFTGNEIWAPHHFPPPNKIIMPAHLQREAVVQAAILFRSFVQELENHGVMLAKEGEVKFGEPVIPSDTLVLEVKLLHLNHRSGKVCGSATKKSTGKLVVSPHEFVFFHFEPPLES